MTDDDRDDETRQRMFQLHPVERMSALLTTIVAMHPRDSDQMIHGFLATTKAVAVLFDPIKRGAIANKVRDIADEIEYLE